MKLFLNILLYNEHAKFPPPPMEECTTQPRSSLQTVQAHLQHVELSSEVGFFLLSSIQNILVQCGILDTLKYGIEKFVEVITGPILKIEH